MQLSQSFLNPISICRPAREDKTVTKWPECQTVWEGEINILQDTTRPSLSSQATVENYNSEYSVLLILGLHTNILVLIDKTINQISSQKKKMFCILFDSFIKQISQHSSFLGRALFLKCSSS